MDKSDNIVPVAVIFRRWKSKVLEMGGVVALFPMIPETKPGEVLSYERIGQHGAAHYSKCIQGTRPVDPSDPDVQALKAELERMYLED